MDLKKAAVLVTGGSCGIGFETARLLRERGARVAICARHEDMLDGAARQIGAIPIVADVSKEDDVHHMIDSVIKEYDDYNVLINNAGFGAFAPLVDLTAEEFFRVWQTNVLGANNTASSGPAGSIFIPQGACEEAVKKLVGGDPPRRPECSPG
jgi:3-oxoacyl-[acyl-carrier protein] reductase